MEITPETLVVGVRFSKVGKIYHFATNELPDLKTGDQVVVETSRGWQLGQVAQIVQDAEPPPEGWKPIDRRATPRDLLLRQMWQQREADVVEATKKRAGELRLMGIKIVGAEYSFDGSRLTVMFSSDTDEKYDLKSLRQDMQKVYGPSQVEMRQIGPRDVAKTMCGMGACGLEKRCCCSFLTEFSSISIRMAKEQGISLTPTEITGMCGRLRCCLIYEYETYVDARATLPKRNKRVKTPQGEGKVIDIAPLRGTVIVDLPDVGYREFPGADVSLVEPGEQTGRVGRPALDAEEKPPEVPEDAIQPGDIISGPQDGFTGKYQPRPAMPPRADEPARRPDGEGQAPRRDERRGPQREGDRKQRSAGGQRRDRGGRGPRQGGQQPPARDEKSPDAGGQQRPPSSSQGRPQRRSGPKDRPAQQNRPAAPGDAAKGGNRPPQDNQRSRAPKGPGKDQRRRGRQQHGNDGNPEPEK